MREKMCFGYIRVSSREQNVDRQVIALRDFGVPQPNLYIDHQSGKDFNRPRYRALLRRLHGGDVLVIKSIDRLGRNYREILEQWRFITKVKKADIVVLDMALLDTRSKERDLTGTLIADVVLQLLSYVAQTERDFIRSRQAEGIAAARARGVQFGAPRKQPPPQFAALRAQWQAGQLSARRAAQMLAVAPNTFLTWCRRQATEK